MPKNIHTIVFWILQFVGWGFITTANIWSKIYIVPQEKTKWTYFLWEGFIFLFLGIALTTLFRNYLKRIDFIASQTTINYLKASIAFFIISVIFGVVLLVCAHYLYTYINDKESPVKTLVIVSTMVNIAIFLLIWIIIYMAVKSAERIRQQKMNQLRLEASLKESQLNTLKGQLNPHFMFNSLNNIRGLMLEDVDKSRDMLTRLSEMLRYSLNVNKVDAIPIAEELETVENYIALSKIQLEDRLRFQKEINEELLKVKIPPMVLQMLIENAIKHGVSNQKNGGIIKLIISNTNDEIILQVNNTGSLKSGSSSTQIGIENIKKRLQLLYGTASGFTLAEKENQVQAIIKIPLS